ncbi:L-glyceraldehyde 3-phosphate reductase [Hymenobacter sp. H14-R3]|uniref:L-glyceraldehyde 3-phosphate reductase n=1 Tax=Hymenobacter sp. H14-R3 TaxID=3046308 RepID=UPI0024B90866|nr:L-glyceraldehyde 3-phosphate reductase [Hymenobacter sp. H14-R3]MDJ0364632.1 L-glyceraldehyde 3-phosphate reductase [Hymenobacter sp. H14-R3]
MAYQPNPARYEAMEYRRCGRSGLQLPAVSVGLWQNFGEKDAQANCRAILRTAFDAGVTHFDLANNYGPPPGAAEEMFGRLLRTDFQAYRDELIISTKAGYGMWPGPYGDGGSRKYLMASLDQSLRRMGLDYVDIYYHHRPDSDTPVEESMGALDALVRQGKALYVGLSSYSPAETRRAVAVLRELGTPCLIHQPKYSMLVRDPEQGLLDVLAEEGVGCIPFSPLAQGLLTDKYLQGIPDDSRVARNLGNGALEENQLTPANIAKAQKLNALAQERGQTMAQLALAWVLKDPRITSVIIGASKPQQVTDAVGSLANYQFSAAELARIEEILQG